MKELTQLYHQFQHQQLTPEEQDRFIHLLSLPENGVLAKEIINSIIESWEFQPELPMLEQEELHAIRESIYNSDFTFNENLSIDRDSNDDATFSVAQKELSPQATTKPFSRKLYINSIKWAAALIIVAVSFYIASYYTASQKAVIKEDNTAFLAINETEQIVGGSTRAVLTINNQQNIPLDTFQSGIQINQNTINYTNGQNIAHAVKEVQISTPKGSQYQVTLSDGTKVWLNAASSISFPANFDTKERAVSIQGELFFEVAKDTKKPFKVYAQNQEIEVLGTSFNINTYADEPFAKTTVISGSIRVSKPHKNSNQNKGQNNSIVLQPYEQLILANTAFERAGGDQNFHPSESLMQKEKVLTDQVIAWKSGTFNFNQAGLKEVMRQLSRWYDVDVIYKNEVPDIKFGGEMSRSVPLSELLKVLRDMDIRIQWTEGRKLIVMP